MLRDQIVMGIYDKKVQLRMFEQKDLTYDQAVEKGRLGETTREQVDTMNKSADVHEIRSNDKPRYNTSNVVDSQSRNKNNNSSCSSYNRNSTPV